MGLTWTDTQKPMSTRMAVGLAASAALALGWLIGTPDSKPMIGSNVVPADMHCEEDEVIAFDQTTPVPHSLGCVHIEDL